MGEFSPFHWLILLILIVVFPGCLWIGFRWGAMKKEIQMLRGSTQTIPQPSETSQRKSHPIGITIAVIGIFVAIVWVGEFAETGRTPDISGMISTVSNTITLPDHPTTPQILEWSQKCQLQQASAETCDKLNTIVTAKLAACRSRIGVRDLIAIGGMGNMSPARWLAYCDEKFPDIRQ